MSTNTIEEDNQKLSEDTQEALQVILALLLSGTENTEIPQKFKHNTSFNTIFTILKDVQNFCSSIKEGDLTYSTKTKSYYIGQLKGIQMELRNMVWQMEQIANGHPYIRSVIMGEISTSFNAMIDRLALTIQELRKISAEFQEISTKDPLTGTLNRNALKRDFIYILESAIIKSQPCGLFILDIDFFKNVNDIHGHYTGDAVLKEFVNKIYQSIRDTDLCCRMGGEEFVLLIPNATEEGLYKIDTRLRENVNQIAVTSKKNTVSITHSAGMTLFTPLEASESFLGKVLEFTDDLLYQAKHNGRNCTVYRKYN